MNFISGFRLSLALLLFVAFSTTAFADNSYDRELIVKGDKTRAMQVEVAFKELMAAYEDEDAQGFLDLVSDVRFRQDYITFTDALYSDFRDYDIHHVDYWIDRVVPDHIKQFLYVSWEKRYENLDDGQQMTTSGFSRFLFDDVEGKYMLVELVGNSLFGASLPEWNDELGQISGQETAVVADTPADTTPSGQPDLVVTTLDYSSNFVYYRVDNTGTATSSACQVEARYTGNDSAIYYSDTGTVPSLPIGDSYSGSLQVDGPGIITVDFTGVVTESNEGNNTDGFSY